MTNKDNQLFSPAEALERLSQNQQQGCLLISKGAELISIYVQNGFVTHATAGLKQGKEAVAHALHLTEASYVWVRGTQSAEANQQTHLNLKEFVHKKAEVDKTRIAETGRLAAAAGKKEATPKYRYFLIPSERPTLKIYLVKTATVLGRDQSSDIFIDNHDVSRRHCLLDVQERGLFLLDLDSSNGTYVNGLLVKEGYLNPRDRLELGAYIFIVNREPAVPDGLTGAYPEPRA